VNDPIFIDGNERLPSAKKALPDLISKLPTIVEDYIEEMLPLWKRFNSNKKTTDEASKIITAEKCILPTKGPHSDTKGQPGFDRLAIILNQVMSAIIVYPPVKGDPVIFQSILEHIYENRFNQDPELVILFAPPFYSTTTFEVNKNILANFIQFKMNKETVAKVHILTQHTDANKMIGCNLYSDTDKPNKPLVNMLEPTYVIYPFTRTVDDTMVGSILFSASSANEVNLPASNIRQMSSVSSYFSGGGRGSLAYPPDVTNEDHFINKMSPPFIYRFYGPKAEPFDGTILKIDLKGEDLSEEMRQYGLDQDRFIGMDEDRLTIDGVELQSIKILDVPYSIRKPTLEVKKDWDQYKFTKDEAEMLRKLQIRPSILNSSVFGGDGSGMLVKFLTNLINSKCYTERELLTNEECSISEDFIDKIYSYLLEHDPRIEEGIQAKKDEQLRIEEQVKRNREAELAAAAALQNAEMYKQILKRFRKKFGLDDSVTDESLEKNPYEDDQLIAEEDVHEQEFNVPLEEMDTGRFYMFIITMNMINLDANPNADPDDSFIIGKLYVNASKIDDVDTAVDAKIQQLSKEYPGWKFFKEPGELQENEDDSPPEPPAPEPPAPAPPGPTARRPSGPTARRPSGPTARRPSGPTARRPSGPTARRPSGPTARRPSGPNPVAPTASKPTGTV
jgi:hypothetical protein